MPQTKLGWEIIIGLEIHVGLNTKSKLFSCAPNRFGNEPNTNITEVCTAQPGSLPVLNKEAVRKAVQFGCAINANVSKISTFDRKSYFYPDSPRNYQITQHANPIIKGGIVVALVDGEEVSFTVDHVHLEDDSGMLKHLPTYTGIDYNRAGNPLIEIVSTPSIRSSKEAVAYAQAVKAILQYIDVSDCNMEEGSIRMDANVSVRKLGETSLRNKIEIKNMNSFSNMEMALEFEIKRQIMLYHAYPDKPHREVIMRETFRWDPERKETILMRKKENEEDYRYFPEPDLVPIVLTGDYIEAIRIALPELPLQRKKRYIKEFGLTTQSASALINDKHIADYFEETMKYSNSAKSVSNWMMVEFAGRFNEYGKNLINSEILPIHIAKLVNLIDKGTITGKIAKAVADDMVKLAIKDPELIVKENSDYQPINNLKELRVFVDRALTEHPQSVIDFKAGKEKSFAFLIGQIMKHTHGKASPKIVNALLKQCLEQL